MAKNNCLGLLVVHGIGEQAKDKTRENIVDGLLSAYPGVAKERRENNVVIIDGFDREIRVYEVFWRKELSGKKVWGSFDIEFIHEVVGFPLLNRRHVSGFKDDYPGWKVWMWTLLLMPLIAILSAAYWGLFILAELYEIISKRKNREWRKERRKNRLKRSNSFTRLLDQTVGDVFNYVNSAGEVEAADGQVLVPEAANRIYDIFKKTLKQAAEECSEIQVIAHSLGTLITYHALTRYREETLEYVDIRSSGEDGKPRLSHLYTIGSPLEKIRFFWPKLIASGSMSASQDSDMVWYNFSSCMDLVSGVLRSFEGLPEIRNHKVLGSGGLVTAHSGYKRNRRFLSVFGKGLTGKEASLVSGWWKRAWAFILMIGESLMLPVVLVGLAGLGIFLLYFYGGLLGSVLFKFLLTKLGELTSWAWPTDLGLWLQTFLAWMAPMALIVFSIPAGLGRARKNHESNWRSSN